MADDRIEKSAPERRNPVNRGDGFCQGRAPHFKPTSRRNERDQLRDRIDRHLFPRALDSVANHFRCHRFEAVDSKITVPETDERLEMLERSPCEGAVWK